MWLFPKFGFVGLTTRDYLGLSQNFLCCFFKSSVVPSDDFSISSYLFTT